MDDYLVPVPEQGLRGCPAQPVGGTGDEDACQCASFRCLVGYGVSRGVVRTITAGDAKGTGDHWHHQSRGSIAASDALPAGAGLQRTPEHQLDWVTESSG